MLSNYRYCNKMLQLMLQKCISINFSHFKLKLGTAVETAVHPFYNRYP